MPYPTADSLTQALKTAMLARDTASVSVLRMIKVALQNETIAAGHELSEPETYAVLRRELKKREESATAYLQAGRAEQAQTESDEADVIRGFLPAQLSYEQIKERAAVLIASLPEDPAPQPGPLIGRLAKELGTSADGSQISQAVRELLAG